MHRTEGLAFSLVVGMFGLHATPMAANQLGTLLTLDPHPARIVGVEALAKRAMDLTLGSLALICAAPIMVVLVVTAYLRRGNSGLQREAYSAGGRIVWLRHHVEPAWARQRHLARLPQLVEVVRGRMSFLGPRPILAKRVAEYGEDIHLLDAAKPGFVGPWWIVGRARPEDPRDELGFDLYYLTNYSLWLDMGILLRATVSLLFGGPGASFARRQRAGYFGSPRERPDADPSQV
jgi:lipopolysaccharide/colanic/teichoic acid biosynthesis glycosyltransferase